MPWKENTTMDLRVRLIQEYHEGESIAALAEMYGVARKTVYKWLARHDAAGVAGLADRSRVPKHIPGRVSEEVVAMHRGGASSLALGAAQVAGEAGRRASGDGVAGARAPSARC